MTINREQAHEQWDDCCYLEQPAIDDMIDDIYDSFESRTCDSCKLLDPWVSCPVYIAAWTATNCNESEFGCNKFVRGE